MMEEPAAKRPRIDRPLDENGSEEDPIVLCSSMKAGERTMDDVLEEFKESYKYNSKINESFVDHWLDLFVHSFAREWQCCGDGCEYRESPISAAYAYAISHGASKIADNINEFLSYFLIRKCASSSYENKRVATVMSKLVDFLNQKDIIDAKKKKGIKSEIRRCNAVDGDKILKALSKLKKENYWKSLPAEEGYEAEDHGEAEEVSFNDFSDSISPEAGLTVRAVTNEVWLFEYESSGFFSDYDSGEDDNYGEAFLRLPPTVAKLGRKGMNITCISLGQRADNGLYEPFNVEFSYGDPSILYGGIYP